MRGGGQGRTSTKTKLAEEMIVLGALLVRARERSGLKQFELADRLAVPASYLSKVEKGMRRLDVIEFLRIAEAMGADPCLLVNELRETMRREQGEARAELGSP